MPTHPPPATVPPARLDPPLRWVRSDAGFTLIEVLVSALMVILIASATAGALIATAGFSGDQRFRSQADQLATQDQERLRGLSDEQLSGLSQTRTVSFAGSAMTFSVKSVATFLDTTGASSCTSTAAAYYKIASTVSWTENSGSPPVALTDESLLTRPVTGDMLVQMTDQTGQSLPGVAVSATGPSGQTGLSDTNGCVLFAGLTPGAYAVGLTDAGYVDPNGNSSPAGTATVTITGTATASGSPFRMGLAGSIVGTFTTTTSGVGGEADTISWLGNGASYGMTGGYRATTPSAPVTTLPTLALFPFDVSSVLPASYANNYAVWGGRCLQQEPSAGYDHYPVTPGSINQAQPVQEPLLDVAVNYANGSTTAVKPAHVKLTFASTAGTGCSTPYTWSPTISSAATLPATGWLANPGQPFASAATTGATASAASTSSSPQAGSLTVCADYAGYKNSVTVNNNSFTSMNPATILITHSFSNLGTC